MMVGSSLHVPMSIWMLSIQRTAHSRSDTGLNDPFCDVVQASLVGLIVAFIYGEVKVISTIYLDVDKAGTVRRV